MTSDHDMLMKLLRMLGSDQIGERASAALKAHALAEKMGGWEKVLATAPPPPLVGLYSQNPYSGYSKQAPNGGFNTAYQNYGGTSQQYNADLFEQVFGKKA